MFLLNKVSTTRHTSSSPSREFIPDQCDEIDDSMDYMYSGYPEKSNSNGRERRPSRIRTSFFGGGRRRSLELAPEEDLDGFRVPSRTLTDDTEGGSPSLYGGRRRRLRKMSSKSSLSSITSFSFSESSNEGKSKSRLFPETLFRGNPWAPPAQQAQLVRPKTASISSPFNFTHLTQANPRDASQLRYGAPQDIGEEWNKALHRESQSRPDTAQTFTPEHFRGESVATTGTLRARLRSNSVKSISPAESFSDLLITPASPIQYDAPSISPPLLRTIPRQCISILEHPDEEVPLQDPTRNDNDVLDDSTLVAVPEEEEEEEEAEEGEQQEVRRDEHGDERGGDLVGHAVTTPDGSYSGQKSPGVEKLFGSEPDEDEDDEYAIQQTLREHESIPEIRETQSTPDLIQPEEDFDTGYRHQMFLNVRARPLSQLSRISDTLNGNFVVPPCPIVRPGSIRARRVSRRLSAHMRLHAGFASDPAAIDSWEQDIDWCYEHEAEADCDFDWDKDSYYAGSNDDDEPQAVDQSSRPPSPVLETNTLEPAMIRRDLVGIPEDPKEDPREDEDEEEEDEEAAAMERGGRYEEEGKGIKEEELLFSEKRITGVFEDRLLLPPSPRFAPSSFGFSDSGFESVHIDDQSLLMRAGNIAARHRSISASSLPDLIPARSHREELYRVARQLDEHIAALNMEAYYHSPPPPLQTIIPKSILSFTGNRARADSQTTCVTLCSDTDTITPTETNEAITPSSSAHNSFHFTKTRASTVSGAGFAVEGRIDKGLSFPAAAIPGVVELGPDSLLAIYHPGEAEFVHYI